MSEPLVAALGEHRPEIAEDAFLAPGCFVLGRTRVGARTSVWYGTVIRADAEAVSIGTATNLQDGCVLHADPGFPLRIGHRVTVGHRAVVHGATVADDVLIGMGATVLNGARVGSWSLIAAGAVVPQGMEIPEGSLVAGVPGKIVRTLRDNERETIAASAEGYVQLAQQHQDTAAFRGGR